MTASSLDWGRHYLMCPPTHFEVAYAINPWMGGQVDPDLAATQWETLVSTMLLAGADVSFIDPVAGLPDMVFTANAGIIDERTFISSSMQHPQRRPETGHFTHWAGTHGYTVEPMPPGATFEGLGDCLPLGQSLVSGYGARSTRPAHTHLSRLTGRPVIGVQLSDPRWYHVDLTLCPLDDRRAIVYPDAYDRDGASRVMQAITEPLILDQAEAATFAANSVVMGQTVIMPACPSRVGRQLQAWGFDVVVVDVSEFLKAGGAVRCLTLALDTNLSVTPEVAKLVLEVA